MAQFDILGAIVDNESSKETFEDLCPLSFSSFIRKLDKDEELTININSPGGSVSAGIAIANMIRKCQSEGHYVVANITGVAASIASVIACACDEIVLNRGTFLMIHNAWSIVLGNSNDLRKEADVMDKMNEAIISFYRSKFNLTDEQLKKMMDDETWIGVDDVETYSLKATIGEEIGKYKIAACLMNKLPKNLKETMMQNEEIKEEIVEEQTVSAEVEEQIEAKEVIEDKPEVKEAMITEEEASKRVSGMQASMQKQINQIKAEYDAKITDFRNQLELKQKELDDAKTESINLQNQLDTTKQELSEMTSACAEQKDALATLNANVNKQSGDNTDWRKLKGKEFLDWYNKNH